MNKKIRQAIFIIILLLISTTTNYLFFNEKNINTTSTDTIISTNLKDIPEFSGNPYVVLNNNIPEFSSEDYAINAFEKYSELDSLGRCGVAFANICKEIMPNDDAERTSLNSITPSGWKQQKYENIIDGNYLYNRCHLIAYNLAGENDNKNNLITGTRYMNIEGMLPFEMVVSDYLDSNIDNHVLYRVTPIFIGNNLVANGVQMEAFSVEDNGNGVCFNVYVYNVQPGIDINYYNGYSKLAS